MSLSRVSIQPQIHSAMISRKELLAAKTLPLTRATLLKNIFDLKEEYEGKIAELQSQAPLLAGNGYLLKIAEYRELLAIIPGRIEEAKRQLADAKDALTEASRRFLAEFLKPRLENQLAAAREQVREELVSILVKADQLDSRVERSALVVEVKQLVESLDAIKEPCPVSYAERLLQIHDSSVRLESMAGRLRDASVWNQLVKPVAA